MAHQWSRSLKDIEAERQKRLIANQYPMETNTQSILYSPDPEDFKPDCLYDVYIEDPYQGGYSMIEGHIAMSYYDLLFNIIAGGEWNMRVFRHDKSNLKETMPPEDKCLFFLATRQGEMS